MGLVSFDACDEVLAHLTSEARQRVGPYGLGHGNRMVTLDSGAVAEGAAASAEVPHSTTNVQEAGVDEPDVVKTDGRMIVTVTGSDLRVVDVADGSPEAVGRLSLGTEYVNANLLLSGDHALVLLREHRMVPLDEPATSSSGASLEGSVAPPAHGPSRASTKVLLVDLADPSDPEVDSTLRVDGDYLDARMVDGTVRLVVRSHPGLSFPLPRGADRPDEDELIARNRDIIASATINDWLPSYQLTNGDRETSGQLVGCDRLDRPPEFAGFSTLSVLTLDITAEGLSDGDAVGVLARGETVYASAERLYVATTRWGDSAPLPEWSAMMEPRGDVDTGIHAFDIAGDDAADYLASGEVRGRIIGRHAMSEHDGILRVATTHRSESSAGKKVSALVTLDERGNELVRVGSVGGLGKGEDIYSVRYVGDTGYVVTFRQIDPLYVLDLSDPANPAVRGELKITGYSAYLHDVGNDRLIGVGQEATAEGRTVGTQVSLFDVGDPSAPTKLDGHVVPDAWSQVERDSRRFLYWPDTRQLVVPLDAGGSSRALVLRVDDESFAAQGMVARSDDAPSGGHGDLERSLVIGDTLYTLWTDGLQANDLDDLEPQGWTDL